MRALCYHGKEDIRCDTVPDPSIEHPRDAIIKVTSCAICGSDLHIYDGFMPGMMSGDILGHETMGEVVEVGKENKVLKVGDRVVIPFTIFCGECEQCKRQNYSVCERTNRNKDIADKVFGHTTAGLFGYTHLTGGYAGGQAEYLRVPYADTTNIKVPEGISDEKLLFLSDILPTGWQAAVQCDIEPTDTVAIWGAGPVGQMAIRSAILLGAREVISIDNVPERLAMAKAGGATTINFDEESVLERLAELTHGKGPEKCIDAVGMEAHATRSIDSMYDRAKQAMMLESDRPARPAGDDVCVPARRHAFGSGRLRRPHRQDPLRGLHEQGTHDADRPNAREPLDGRSATPHRTRRNRSFLRDHPHGRPRGGTRNVPGLPRQGGQLREGRAQTRTGDIMSEQHTALHQRDIVTSAAPAVAKGLGWFSIALGCAELFGGRPLTRALGMKKEVGVFRAYGAREIATGIGILTARDPSPWLWGRVAGDVLDLGTLAIGLRRRNRHREEVVIAMAMVAGVTALDVVCAQAMSARPNSPPRPPSRPRDYRDRSGFLKSIAQMRGVARGVTLENPNPSATPGASPDISSAL